MNQISLLPSTFNDAKYFEEQNTKHAEMRRMLDSRQPKERLEAMKRLIAMMTLGRDVSVYFPDVVKNVITPNVEIKKLVYMYLISYAETNQELALLCINTLQKDLASSSQRARANAMRAMSSIRIPVVVPLVMLALKSTVKDTSPYVRKAAAAAIPKVYDASRDSKDELIPMIEHLLTSTEPEILSSAVFAFNEVCPDRIDLLHQHFRKICTLLADFTEWGQMLMLRILTRYGRSQYLSPFDVNEDDTRPGAKKKKKQKAFYSDDEQSDSDMSSSDSDEGRPAPAELDKDHALLLKQALLLIQSRNSGVIMALVSLYFALAPVADCHKVIKPMMRMVRNRREISYVLLCNASTLAAKRPELFRPYLKDFFIHGADPRYLRDLKLDCLASIAADQNIGTILKEFEAYVRDPDKRFVGQVVEALGRCAQALPEIADRCMELLVKLMSSSDQSVVAQSVIVIRQLLQGNAKLHSSVIRKVAELADTVRVPSARAAIVWMIGEYVLFFLSPCVSSSSITKTYTHTYIYTHIYI